MIAMWADGDIQQFTYGQQLAGLQKDGVRPVEIFFTLEETTFMANSLAKIEDRTRLRNYLDKLKAQLAPKLNGELKL